MGGDGDPLEIVQEIEIWPYYQMVHAQIRILQAREIHKILWDFEIQTDKQIPATRPNLVITKKKKKKEKKKRKEKESTCLDDFVEEWILLS